METVGLYVNASLKADSYWRLEDAELLLEGLQRLSFDIFEVAIGTYT